MDKCLDEWEMIVTHEDGTQEHFKGKRTLSDMILGAKKYMENLKQKQNEN